MVFRATEAELEVGNETLGDEVQQSLGTANLEATMKAQNLGKVVQFQFGAPELLLRAPLELLPQLEELAFEKGIVVKDKIGQGGGRFE